MRLPGQRAFRFSQAQGNSGSADRAPQRRAAGQIAACDRDAPARCRPRADARSTDIDPTRDATVLLIGRGGAYPALSVALGERIGVVGALSIEAAAKHLNARDIDGIVLGEGFSAARGRRVPDRAGGGCAFPQPARGRDFGRTGAEPMICPISKSSPAIRHRSSATMLAAGPPARLRSASEPHAALDRCRRPARRAHRPAHAGGLRSRFRHRRLSDPCRAAADCRWRALPSIPNIPAPSSMARGLSAA